MQAKRRVKRKESLRLLHAIIQTYLETGEPVGSAEPFPNIRI